MVTQKMIVKIPVRCSILMHCTKNVDQSHSAYPAWCCRCFVEPNPICQMGRPSSHTVNRQPLTTVKGQQTHAVGALQEWEARCTLNQTKIKKTLLCLSISLLLIVSISPRHHAHVNIISSRHRDMWFISWWRLRPQWNKSMLYSLIITS